MFSANKHMYRPSHYAIIRFQTELSVVLTLELLLTGMTLMKPSHHLHMMTVFYTYGTQRQIPHHGGFRNRTSAKPANC